MKRRIENNAFTLAEVLITLSIIGIVAALTIPMLINQYEERVYAERTKEAYSMLSQAMQGVQNETQGAVVWGYNSTVVGGTALRDDFCNALKCVKKFQPDDFTVFKLIYSAYKTTNPTWYPWYYHLDSAAILSNGMILDFNSDNDCNQWPANNIPACGRIYVDVNGIKGPNMFGKDMQQFWILLEKGAYRVMPFGYKADGLTCTVNSGVETGLGGCTAQRLFSPESMP